MYNLYKYASRNRAKFYRWNRRKPGHGRKVKRPVLSISRAHKAPVINSFIRSGNLRSVSDKRKRIDYGHASKKFMKLASSLGVVGRGIYSLAKNDVKRRFRGRYEDPTYVEVPAFDIV